MIYKVGDRLKATASSRKGDCGTIKEISERPGHGNPYLVIQFKWDGKDPDDYSSASLKSFIWYYKPILIDENGEPKEPETEWVDLWDLGAGDENE